MFKIINLKDQGFDKKRFDVIEKTWNEAVLWQQPVTLKPSSPQWNYEEGYNATVTLAASATLGITGLKPGAYGTLEIIQGGSGSYTLTLPTNFTNKVANGGSGAFTLTTTVGAIDTASFYYNGSYLLWTLSNNFT